jgi:hypothetical protein
MANSPGALTHYADAVSSEPGQCWRFVYRGPDDGRPMHCPAPVVVTGSHRLTGGKRIPVWSCEGHVEGVERSRTL